MVGSSLTRQKQAWLQAREELRQAQIVTVKQGLSLTPSLYFGTRRCTYSNVVSVVTTALPLSRYDPLDQQATINEVPNDASRWAEERAREALTRLKQFDDNQSGESETRPPYATAKAIATRQQQTLALVREQRAFMKSLHNTRRERARREYEAALIIQRVRRGYVLRRQFRGIRQKLLVRKRIRGSLLQVTKGTALVLGEKDRRQKMQAKHTNAAVKIQNAFRVWGARRLLAKLRALHVYELRHRLASIIQNAWRASTARWVTTKLRLQQAQARRQALARVVARLFVGFQTRCRVRAMRLHRQQRAAFRLQSFVRCQLLAAKALTQARERITQERGHSGAAGMQTLVRGMLQRAYVAKMRRAEELAVRIACTLSIQRVARGFLGRQRARRRGLQRAHERGWICAMNVTRIARGFLGRLEASRERAIQEADLLVQARRGNVDAVVDLLDGFDPSSLGQQEDAVDDDLPAIQPADVTVVSIPGGNHALHLAAKFGHLEVVTLILPRLLSAAPELVYARNAKGFTALALAVINGNERVAMYMLAMTSRLFVDHVLPGRRRTLLHEAARLGLETVVAKLLQLFPQTFTGAELDAWTQRTAIHEALLVGIEVVQDGELFPWSRHHAHAHRSAYSPDEEVDHAMAVLEILLAKAPHAPLEAKDFLGFTPLHIAAARGNLRAVTRLLEFGADVSVKDEHDRTAWRVALLCGHDVCFQEIRRKWLHDVVSNSAGQKGGASESMGGSNASTARTVVTPAGSTSMALHPQLERELFAACRRGDVAKMRFFIDECDVSVNAVEDVESDPNADESAIVSPFRPLGRSLLMVACEHRQLRAVHFLLGKGNLNVKYAAGDGYSALTIAQQL